MKKHYPLLALLTITALVGLITSHAGAAERKPSKADYKNLEDIKQNQICLHDNRQPFTRITNSFRNKEKVEPKDIPSYNRFLDCKTWNALEVAELNKNGWNVDWFKMELVDTQISQSKAPPSVPTPKKVSGQPGKINLAEFGEKDRLSHDQLIQVLRDAGFNGKALEVAYAVARAESGHRPKAYNGNAKSGDKSYGIFQINMLGYLGPARRKQYGIASNEELFQPEVAARAAYILSSGGTNWKPWSAYKNGAYKKYLTSL